MSGNNDSPGSPCSDAESACSLTLTAEEASYVAKLLSLFRANRVGTHGFAESTTKNYMGCLDRVIREIGRPPWEWTPQDIDGVLARRHDQGVTAGTQMQYITALRGFQNYLLEDIGLCNQIQRQFGVRPQRYITEDNSIPYKRKGRKRAKIITPLSPEQCGLLLDEFQFQIDVAYRQHSKSFNTLRRDYAITVLGLSYGVRADEISGIEIGHFLADRKYAEFGDFAILRVIGKGRKERAIRLYAPAAASVLQWYIEHVRPAFLTEKTTNPNLMFLSERGRSLCNRQYRRSLAAVAAAAGLPMRVHPHLLRHTYATEMAQIIGPTALQQQLGHEHLSTTLGTYYHPNPEHVGNEVLKGIEAMTAAFDEITKEDRHANYR